MKQLIKTTIPNFTKSAALLTKKTMQEFIDKSNKKESKIKEIAILLKNFDKRQSSKETLLEDITNLFDQLKRIKVRTASDIPNLIVSELLENKNNIAGDVIEFFDGEMICEFYIKLNKDDYSLSFKLKTNHGRTIEQILNSEPTKQHIQYTGGGTRSEITSKKNKKDK